MLSKDENCTGCSSCFNVCPSRAITMHEDAEGFLRPQIAEEKCIQCGLCDKSCPSLNPVAPNPKSSNVFACWTLSDEIRAQSTSGGVFSALALSVLRQSGIVVAAECDNNFHLRHIVVTDASKLDKTRRSKYWQSDLGFVFLDIKKALNDQREVLFVGTPCQVAGLYAFLGKLRDDANLFTVDIVCGGVPSPKVFRRYIQYLRETLRLEPTSINLRDKSRSWEFTHTSVQLKNGKKRVLREEADWFKLGFYKSLYDRPCCQTCPYASMNRVGDVTIGDYWDLGKLDPFPYPKKKGVSLLICNTKQGEKLLAEIQNDCFFLKRQAKELVQPRLHHAKPAHPKRAQFFDDLEKLPIEVVVKKYLRRSWKQRLRSRIASLLPTSICSYILQSSK